MLKRFVYLTYFGFITAVAFLALHYTYWDASKSAYEAGYAKGLATGKQHCGRTTLEDRTAGYRNES